MRRTVLTVLSLILDLIGFVFIFQGVGILPGSFMTGEMIWAAVGGILLFVSMLLFWFALKPKASRS